MKINFNEIGNLKAEEQEAIQYLMDVAQKIENEEIKSKETFCVRYKDYIVTGKWTTFGGGNSTLSGITEIIGWEWFEIKHKVMTATEKSLEISHRYAECDIDITFEASSKMAKWLLQTIYDKLDARRRAIKTDEGWDAYVPMKDIIEIINELNGTPVINAETFTDALKSVMEAQFGHLK